MLDENQESEADLKKSPEITLTSPGAELKTDQETLNQVDGASKNPTSKKGKLWLLIAVGILIFGAFIAWAVTNHQPAKNSTANGNVVITGKPSPPLKIEDQKYRIYELCPNENSCNLTLADTHDKVIATKTSKIPLYLIANINNKYFLLKEDDSYASPSDNYGGHFWLMDNSGDLTNLNSAADLALRRNITNIGNSSVILYPVSEQEVVYCDEDINQNCNYLHKLNILTGQNTLYQANDYANLIGVSPDGKAAYTYGAVSSPNSTTSTDTGIDTYDFASSKVTKSQTLTGVPKNFGSPMPSPSGKYLVSADTNKHTISLYDSTTHQSGLVDLGATGAGIASAKYINFSSYIWSPAEDKVSILITNPSKTTSLGYIDAASRKFTLIATTTPPIDNFEGIGWLNNTTLDFGTVLAKEANFGEMAANVGYDTASQKSINLSSKYGALLEAYDTNISGY